MMNKQIRLIQEEEEDKHYNWVIIHSFVRRA